MSLAIINFLHLQFLKIQPGQTFSHCPPTHLDAMGENNTYTALKDYGVKTKTTFTINISSLESISKIPLTSDQCNINE